MDDSIYFISSKADRIGIKICNIHFPTNITLSLDDLDELVPKITYFYYFNDAF